MAPQRIAHLFGGAGRIIDVWSRLGESPPLGWIVAVLASILAAAGHDPFTWAWLLLVLFSATDHTIGVQRARETGRHQAGEAARGRREKAITALLMLGFRAVEGFATGYGLLNLSALLRFIHLDAAARSPVVQHGGIISAVITILIAFDELASIYRHRLADGGPRIMLAELAFNGARAMQLFVLGRAAKKVEGWAGEDAARAFEGTIAAVRHMDVTAYTREHHEELGPARRHYDEALNEVGENPHEGPG